MFWTLLANIMGVDMLLLFGFAVIHWPLEKLGVISEKTTGWITRFLLFVFLGLLGIGMIATLFSSRSSSRGGGRYGEELYGREEPMDWR